MTKEELRAIEEQIWYETNILHKYDVEPEMDTCYLGD